MPINPQTGEYVSSIELPSGQPATSFETPEGYTEQKVNPTTPDELEDPVASEELEGRPTLDQTLENANYQNLALKLYHNKQFNKDESGYNDGITGREAAEWLFDRQSAFEFNVTRMGWQWKDIAGMDDDVIVAWNEANKYWDDTDLDFGETVWHAGRNILTDPTTYVGLGLGKVMSKGAQFAAKKMIKDRAKQAVAQKIMTPMGIGAAEGAVIGGATAAGREHIASDAEDRDYNFGTVAAQGAAGAILGGVVGGALGGAGQAIGARAKKSAYKFESEVKEQAGPPTKEEVGAPEPAPGETTTVKKDNMGKHLDDEQQKLRDAKEDPNEPAMSADEMVSKMEDVGEISTARRKQLEDDARKFREGRAWDLEELRRGGMDAVAYGDVDAKMRQKVMYELFKDNFQHSAGREWDTFNDIINNVNKKAAFRSIKDDLRVMHKDVEDWTEENILEAWVAKQVSAHELSKTSKKLGEFNERGEFIAKDNISKADQLELEQKMQTFMTISEKIAEESRLTARKQAIKRYTKKVDIPTTDESFERWARNIDTLGGPNRSIRLAMLIQKSQGDMVAMHNTLHVGRFRKMFKSTENWAVGMGMNGMLSSPATHVFNIAGMAIHMGVDAYGVRLPLVMFSEGLKKMGVINKNTPIHTFAAWRKEQQATMYGLREGINYFWGTLHQSGYTGKYLGRNVQEKIAKGKDYHTEIAGWKLDDPSADSTDYNWGKTGLRRAVSLPSNGLRAMDEMFKSMFYYRAYSREIMEEVTQNAQALGITEPRDIDKLFREMWNRKDKAIVDKAKLSAQQMTFTDESTSGIRRMASVIQHMPGGRLLLPFVNTIHNLASASVRITPLSMASQRWWQLWRKGGKDRQFAIAQMAFGWGFFGTVFSLMDPEQTRPDGTKTWKPTITGAGPAHLLTRQLLEQTGWKPNSILVNGKYWSYKDLEPLATVLSTVVSFAEGYMNTYGDLQDGDMGQDPEMGIIGNEVAIGLGEALMAGAASGGHGLAMGIVDNTYARDIMDVVDVVRAVASGEGDQAGNVIPKKIASIAYRSIPYSAVLRSGLREGQQYKRDNKVDAQGTGFAKWGAQLKEEFARQLPDNPWFNPSAPLKRNWDGTPIRNDQDMVPNVFRFRGSAAGDDLLANELAINHVTAAAKFDPNISYTAMNGAKYNLNMRQLDPEAFEELAEKTGELRRQYVQEVINSYGYTDLSDNWGEADGAKATALTKAIGQASTDATEWFKTQSRWTGLLEEFAMNNPNLMTERPPTIPSRRAQQQKQSQLRW